MAWRILQLTTVDLTAYCFLRSMMRHFRQAGHQVGLGCHFERFAPDLEPFADDLFPIPIPRRIEPWKDFTAWRHLVRLIRSYQPDIVHTHTSKAGFLGRMAARWCGVPLILHTVHELPQNASRNPWVKSLYRTLERTAAGWSHHLVTTSGPNRQQILAEGITDEAGLTQIRIGLELDKYRAARPDSQLRARFGIAASAPLVGIAGRMEPVKGHADLFRAWQLVRETHPEAHLVVLGSGQLQDSLLALRGQLGLEASVHFAGFVPDLISSLAALDLFVLPSYYEGLGVVLVEALAVGTPVISSGVGGTRDVVQPEVTGLVAPPGDPRAWAEQIRRLLDDRELARRLTATGQARVYAQFSARDTDEQMLSLYARLWQQRCLNRG